VELNGWNYWHIKRAAVVVRGGGVIAYPTEAVFGVGCDPWNQEAVYRILCLKQRDVAKGLILIAAAVEQLSAFVDFPEDCRERVCSTWPGPVTWVLPARAGIPRWLRGDNRGVAVRVTAHPQAKALCQEVGVLVSTSANPGGTLPARSANKVRAYFRDGIDYLMPGQVDLSLGPSEIRDAVSGRVLRARDTPRS
jgi:L-threonylcarbamoyladenylate synthase